MNQAFVKLNQCVISRTKNKLVLQTNLPLTSSYSAFVCEVVRKTAYYLIVEGIVTANLIAVLFDEACT